MINGLDIKNMEEAYIFIYCRLPASKYDVWPETTYYGQTYIYIEDKYDSIHNRICLKSLKEVEEFMTKGGF